MIRVNLISVTPGQTPKRDWFPKEQRSAAVGLVLLLSTAVGVTSWWGYLRHERAGVERAILAAETELARLKDVAVLVDKATARKAELAERIDLIERLRATMRGPVRLLETVSSSVPHGLWLIEVKQTGSSVRFDGRAMSLTPVTDFAKVMQESGFFQMPIEIDSTTSEIFEEVPVIRFVLKGEIVPTAIPVRASSAVVAGPAPAPGATPPAPGTAPSAAGPVVATVGPRGGGR